MNHAARGTASERWLPIVGGLLLVVGGTLIATGLGRYIAPCLFYETTGLFCPGCGSGRVAKALSHVDFAAAWRANALVVLALPLVGYALVRETLWAWGAAELPWPTIHRRWLWVLLVAILAFWALRNVPVWPLTLLAPH